MANVIRIKRSTGSAAPSSLAQGELAYVEQAGTGDGRLYIGANGATIEEIGGKYYIDIINGYDTDLSTFALPANTTISTFGASLIDDADAATARATLEAGDVSFSGAAPADNAIPRYDGVTGKLIQASGITIADTTNDVTGMGTLNGKTIADLVSTTDTGSVSWTWVIDDDTFGTASATTLPTSESVKAYVDSVVVGGMVYKGGFDPTAGAGAGSPDLDSISSTTGDTYTVTVAGTYNWTTGSAILEVGDVLIAESTGVLNNVASWTIVQQNLSAATQTTPGYVSVGAQTFGGTKTFEDIAGTDAGATIDSFVIDGGSF